LTTKGFKVRIQLVTGYFVKNWRRVG